MSKILSLLLVVTLSLPCFGQKKTRDQKVREDRKKVVADGFWIYNDLPKAFDEAKRTGKPMLVVLRCIPCEECVKLDDDLVDKDPTIRPILEKFVRVRVVSMNGLDLNLFQFDTDQSFAAFMLNSDGTIYGRFGTRSHRTEWVEDVSLNALTKALQRTLELHKHYPANKSALEGKRGELQEFSSPEKYPELRAKYTSRLNYRGNVVQSCIHCHQIGDVQRDRYRKAGKPIPEKVLFPYPHPKTIGLTMNPEEMATVKLVRPGSAAERAGLKANDRIEELSGQPMLSTADIQWVLHRINPKGGKVRVRINREGRPLTLTLSVKDGWRQAGDLSWRSSSWGLRRMTTGGLFLESLSVEERTRLNIENGSMALRVKHVGQYGAHAAAKRTGFRKGDVIVEFDGRHDLSTEGAVFLHAVTKRKPGERVAIKLIRNGKKRTLSIPMQK